MAQNQQGADAGDAIPMQKTSPTVYIAVGVGVVALVAVLGVTLGGDSEAEKKAAEIKAQAEALERDPGMTAKEHREHMKTTAKAFALAEERAKEKKAQAEQRKAQEEQRKSAQVAAAAPPPGAAAAPPPKPKVSTKAKKKQMDSLDSIGSDITSALE